jgi:hypothetical protein
VAARSVHTRLDYRPVPSPKVVPMLPVHWFNPIHERHYITVHSKPALVSVRHHTWRVIQPTQAPIDISSQARASPKLVTDYCLPSGWFQFRPHIEVSWERRKSPVRTRAGPPRKFWVWNRRHCVLLLIVIWAACCRIRGSIRCSGRLRFHNWDRI